MDSKLKSKFCLRAPAKINLWLKVLGRRPDGYHELDMLMAKIDLYDEMEVEETAEGMEIYVDGNDVPCDSSNILWKAWTLLCQASDRSFGLRVLLKKQIPVAAGLGGGSSDAATLLQGVNQHLRLGLSSENLQDLGLKLGADVPFFLKEGPQWARGVGEVLSPVQLAPLYIILLNPQFALSTADVYQWFDQSPQPPFVKGGRGGILLTQENQDATHPTALKEILSNLENDLEKVALPHYPVLATMKERLKVAGALGVLMSGSGPTVYGIFPSLEARDQGYEFLLKEKDPSWWMIKTMSVE